MTRALAGLCFLAAAAGCDDKAPGTSVARGKPDAPAPVADVVLDVAVRDCCNDFCNQAANGCFDAKVNEDACVARACPVPGGLSPAASIACRNAQSDLICCNWSASSTFDCHLVDGTVSAAACDAKKKQRDKACAR